MNPLYIDLCLIAFYRLVRDSSGILYGASSSSKPYKDTADSPTLLGSGQAGNAQKNSILENELVYEVVGDVVYERLKNRRVYTEK